MKHLNKWTRKELLALPHRRDPNASLPYDSILVLPTQQRHDSGYRLMGVIGIRGNVPVEVISSCSDDIEWDFDGVTSRWKSIRTDCLATSGLLHFWSNHVVFNAGFPGSSLCIKLTTK